MSLGNVFVKSVVREVGRNYGKAISNSLLGNKHSTPVRVVDASAPKVLGAGTGGRNYKNSLHKLCETWTIKGPTATFNVAQNMYKEFFDLVEEAYKDDGKVDVRETQDLMENFVLMRNEMNKVREALLQLDKADLEQKVDAMDDNLWDFWFEYLESLVIPDIGPQPKGLFNNKAKGLWKLENAKRDLMIAQKENIENWKKQIKPE